MSSSPEMDRHPRRWIWLLCGVLVLVLGTHEALAKSKKSCRDLCRKNFNAYEDGLISHDPFGVPLCSCLDDDAELLGLYRWMEGQWVGLGKPPPLPKCISGAARCMKDTLEVCRNLQWEVHQQCARGCRDGACVSAQVCAEGSTRCSGASLDICRGGQWTTQEKCANGCQSGRCMQAAAPVCAEGTVRCNQSRREECRSGLWTQIETCPQACRSGQCVASTKVEIRKGTFPHNIVDRPLALKKGMFQVSTGLLAMYAIGEENDYSWAHTHIPLEFSVGAFDFLEFGAGLLASLSEPDGEAMNTHFYALAAPIPQLAVRVGMYFPDSINSDEIGALTGLEGNYPVIPKVLALHGLFRVDHLSQRNDGVTELSFLLGVRWSFVDQFYLGASSGITKVWWGNQTAEDLYGTDIRVPFNVEIGFTSRKQVDLVAHWGWPDWKSSFPVAKKLPDETFIWQKEALRYFSLDLRVRF